MRFQLTFTKQHGSEQQQQQQRQQQQRRPASRSNILGLRDRDVYRRITMVADGRMNERVVAREWTVGRD